MKFLHPAIPFLPLLSKEKSKITQNCVGSERGGEEEGFKKDSSDKIMQNQPFSNFLLSLAAATKCTSRIWKTELEFGSQIRRNPKKGPTATRAPSESIYHFCAILSLFMIDEACGNVI